MLRFEGIGARYGARTALDGVSAQIGAGRLTAVIGANGSGKSTLLKCAAGIVRPASGRVLLSGRDVSAMKDRERARCVAYMPQTRLTPQITVRQLAAHGRFPHLAFGERLRAEDGRVIDRALADVKLLEAAERPVAALSGGERQRAYIAMMLVQEAPVMLLDEPTAFLDPAAQFSLMALLSALCAQGRSALVALHDLPLAMEYAGDVLLLQGGRLLRQGAPEEMAASGCIDRVFGVRLERAGGRFVVTAGGGT